MIELTGITYLIVKVSRNDVNVGTLLHFKSTLHAKAYMAYSSNSVSFSELFFNHFDLTKFFKNTNTSLHLFTFWQVKDRKSESNKDQVPACRQASHVVPAEGGYGMRGIIY